MVMPDRLMPARRANTQATSTTPASRNPARRDRGSEQDPQGTFQNQAHDASQNRGDRLQPAQPFGSTDPYRRRRAPGPNSSLTRVAG